MTPMHATFDGTPVLLKVSDTISLRYIKAGEGPPLLLLHTIRTQLEYFRELAPLLTRKFTVYAVDLPDTATRRSTRPQLSMSRTCGRPWSAC